MLKEVGELKTPGLTVLLASMPCEKSRQRLNNNVTVHCTN